MPGSFRLTEMDNTSFKKSLWSFSQCFCLETEQEGQCCTLSQQAICFKMYILGFELVCFERVEDAMISKYIFQALLKS